MLIVSCSFVESHETPETPATAISPILSIKPEAFTVITGMSVALPYVPESTVAALEIVVVARPVTFRLTNVAESALTWPSISTALLKLIKLPVVTYFISGGVAIFAPPIVKPAPFSAVKSAAESATTIFLSFIVTVVEFTVVVVPCTVRSPVT